MSLPSKDYRPPSSPAASGPGGSPRAADGQDDARPAPADPRGPVWVAEARELWWDGRVVKRLRRVATSQEAVLAAFQAAGWPGRIDDPPPRGAGPRRKGRRREAVRGLNTGLEPRTIRFHADGAGGFRRRVVG